MVPDLERTFCKQIYGLLDSDKVPIVSAVMLASSAQDVPHLKSPPFVGPSGERLVVTNSQYIRIYAWCRAARFEVSRNERFWFLRSHSSIKDMAMLLEGKVAAITGAVTGIGRAIALEYISHGAKVAVNYYPDDRSAAQFGDMQKEVGEGAGLIGVPGDISKPDTGQELVAQAVQQFGKLDVFVSNAGVCQFADFLTFVTGFRPASRQC